MVGIFAFFGYIILFVIVFALAMALSLLVRLFGGFANAWRMLKMGGKAYRTYNNAKKEAGSSYKYDFSSGSTTTGRSTNQSSNPSSNGKIFSADEGEYVDFEEIK